MSGTLYDFYAGGNTARGYASLLHSSLQGLERLYVLRGGAGLGKACGLRSIGDRLAAAGDEIWRISCASDPNALDGLVVPGLRLGIVDGTTPNALVPETPGAAVREIDLGEACDTRSLAARESEFESLNREISGKFEAAYAGFAEALRIHDDWENIYIGKMDFGEADELAREWMTRLFGDRRQEKKAREARRFLGAATPLGAVDFVPGLTKGLKRYLLKGRPGSGKSTMLKKLAAAAAERGFDAEVYHCGFDPNSLDMVVVRELGFAIFDSTAPHEYFPDRPSDEIVDMYERCIAAGTDEAYAEELAPIRQQYSANMKRSIGLLAEARTLLDRLERLYAETADRSVLERIVEEFKRDVLKLASIQA
ncbi:PRK06851 family protein [Cohnella hongkongensis]|uniref:PRK06851 family protein n=1 Tax=Cohnella hongkongensis TaxID=178337 RepID=A0ABV9FDN4_9BACL